MGDRHRRLLRSCEHQLWRRESGPSDHPFESRRREDGDVQVAEHHWGIRPTLGHVAGVLRRRGAHRDDHRERRPQRSTPRHQHAALVHPHVERRGRRVGRGRGGRRGHRGQASMDM